MIIDAHVHLNSMDNVYLDYAVANDIRLLSIITDIPDFPSIEDQLGIAVKLKEKYPDHVDFVCSFPCEDWLEPDWVDKSIASIKKGVQLGAVGVKVWKNIGMTIKDGNGNYALIDHPRLDPIFKFLEDHGIVLLGHVGEPRNCWLPIEEMTVASDKQYFSAHPEYHMYHNKEVPSYDSQLGARHRMLKRYPNLKFIGLHLASLEWSVQKVGEFLDEFPNAMVDLAERICHLQHQAIDDRDMVYDFLIKYQDRIIYGTDIISGRGSITEDDLPKLQKKYDDHRKFFTTTDLMEVPKVYGKFRGLGLPETVVQKIYVHNALRAYTKMKSVSTKTH